MHCLEFLVKPIRFVFLKLFRNLIMYYLKSVKYLRLLITKNKSNKSNTSCILNKLKKRRDRVWGKNKHYLTSKKREEIIYYITKEMRVICFCICIYVFLNHLSSLLPLLSLPLSPLALPVLSLAKGEPSFPMITFMGNVICAFLRSSSTNTTR